MKLSLGNLTCSFFFLATCRASSPARKIFLPSSLRARKPLNEHPVITPPVSYNSLMIPNIVARAHKRALYALWSLWGPRASVENPWPGCYLSLICLLYDKDAHFDIYKPQLNFFAIRRLRFFCSPHHTSQILKISLDLSSFLAFNFDGRPIKLQIHSCRGIIVKRVN